MTNMLAAMHSRPTADSGRESRTLYAINDDYSIGEYIGWSCAPDHPEEWWLPDYGQTLHFGTHVFATRSEAIDAAIDKVAAKMTELSYALKKLRGME